LALITGICLRASKKEAAAQKSTASKKEGELDSA